MCIQSPRKGKEHLSVSLFHCLCCLWLSYVCGLSLSLGLSLDSVLPPLHTSPWCRLWLQCNGHDALPFTVPRTVIKQALPIVELAFSIPHRCHTLGLLHLGVPGPRRGRPSASSIGLWVTPSESGLVLLAHRNTRVKIARLLPLRGRRAGPRALRYTQHLQRQPIPGRL